MQEELGASIDFEAYLDGLQGRATYVPDAIVLGDEQRVEEAALLLSSAVAEIRRLREGVRTIKGFVRKLETDIKTEREAKELEVQMLKDHLELAQAGAEGREAELVRAVKENLDRAVKAEKAENEALSEVGGLHSENAHLMERNERQAQYLGESWKEIEALKVQVADLNRRWEAEAAEKADWRSEARRRCVELDDAKGTIVAQKVMLESFARENKDLRDAVEHLRGECEELRLCPARERCVYIHRVEEAYAKIEELESNLKRSESIREAWKAHADILKSCYETSQEALHRAQEQIKEQDEFLAALDQESLEAQAAAAELENALREMREKAKKVVCDLLVFTAVVDASTQSGLDLSALEFASQRAIQSMKAMADADKIAEEALNPDRPKVDVLACGPEDVCQLERLVIEAAKDELSEE